MLVARNRRPKMLGTPSFPLSRVGLQRVHKGAASVGLTGPNGVMHVLGSRTPMPVRLGAVAWWQFSGSNASSDIIEGATSTDVAGWKDKAFTNVEVSGDLVTNGSFDSSSDWGLQSNWSISSGVATSSGASTANGDRDIFQVGTTEIGKWYRLSLEIVSYTSGTLALWTGTKPVIVGDSLGVKDIVFYSENTNLTVYGLETDIFIGSIDNVKIYELDPATVAYDLTQPTAASQPTFTQPDGPVVFTNDYLEGMPEQTGDFTYAYKLNTSVGFNIIGGSSFTGSELFFIGVGGVLQVRTTAGVFGTIINSDITGADNTIFIKRSGDDFTGYLNGVEQQTFTSTGDLRIDILGSRLLGDDYDGTMYELSVFNRALSDSEIAKLNAYMG